MPLDQRRECRLRRGLVTKRELFEQLSIGQPADRSAGIESADDSDDRTKLPIGHGFSLTANCLILSM
jgi:hypothetical protein